MRFYCFTALDEVAPFYFCYILLGHVEKKKLKYVKLEDKKYI
jgi:hypothetical protein